MQKPVNDHSFEPGLRTTGLHVRAAFTQREWECHSQTGSLSRSTQTRFSVEHSGSGPAAQAYFLLSLTAQTQQIRNFFYETCAFAFLPTCHHLEWVEEWFFCWMIKGQCLKLRFHKLVCFCQFLRCFFRALLYKETFMLKRWRGFVCFRLYWFHIWCWVVKPCRGVTVSTYLWPLISSFMRVLGGAEQNPRGCLPHPLLLHLFI